MMGEKQRIIDLQKQVNIARRALEAIAHGHTRSPDDRAAEALDAMRPKDKTAPLDGILGWSKQP